LLSLFFCLQLNYTIESTNRATLSGYPVFLFEGVNATAPFVVSGAIDIPRGVKGNKNPCKLDGKQNFRPSYFVRSVSSELRKVY
ncbi:hypothetical protein, partial [Ruminococcus sp.]|uniref:hypothetical protein n=1 Tax=Ruminococcus sp. TaxID=41978 RepID=UPI003AB4BC78